MPSIRTDYDLTSSDEPVVDLQSADNLLNEVLGTIDQRLENGAALPDDLTELPKFYDQSGAPITNLATRDSGTVLSMRRNESGALQIDVYPSAQAARNREAALRMVVTYQDTENGLLERREVRDLSSSQDTPAMTIETTRGANAGDLSLTVVRGNERQTTSFRNGVPDQLEIVQTVDGVERHLSFTFAEGRITAVRVNGSELTGQAATNFIQAAEEGLRVLARENNIGWPPVAARESDGAEAPPAKSIPVSAEMLTGLRWKPTLKPDEKPAAKPSEKTSESKPAEKGEAVRVETRPLTRGQELGAPLSEEERRRVTESVANLGSPQYTTREQASADLRVFGLRALAQIVEATRSSDPEVARRASELVRLAVRNLASPIETRGHVQPTGSPLAQTEATAHSGAIAEADRIARDPVYRANRQAQLEAVRAITGSTPAIERSLQELTNPRALQASTRIRYAEALIAANDPASLPAARQNLREALQHNGSLARDARFVTAFVRSGSPSDTEMMTAFRNAGGDANALAAPPVADNQAGRGASTDSLRAGLSGGAAWGRTLGMTADARRTFVQNQGGNLTQAQYAGVLTDHFVTAQNDEQRTEATNALQAAAQAGNAEANQALQRLDFLASLSNPFAVLDRTWGPRQDLSYPDATSRRAAIREVMQNPPLHRPMQTHHEVIHMILDHYRNAQNGAERTEAINWLRDEVQAGNLSAGLALRQLAAGDAMMRYAEASRAFESATDEPGREQARQQQMQALRDLARQAHAEARRADPSAAGSFLDHLARAPRPGINPAEIQQQVQTGQNEAQQREQLARQTVVSAVRGTGSAREQALTQLRALADQQLNTERSAEYQELYNFASFAATASDITRSINTPADAATHMLQLGVQSRTNPQALTALNAIRDGSPAGAALAAAITANNREAIIAALEDQALRTSVTQQLQPALTQVEQLNGIRNSNALEVLSANPELRERLLREAAEQSARDQQGVDDAVHDYLVRDSNGQQIRTDLLGALPASGAMTLAADAPLRQQLQTALDNHLLPRQAERLVRQLLQAGNLPEADVTRLRESLSNTGNSRLEGALGRLNAISRDNLDTGGEFEVTLKTIESMENARAIHERVNAALAAGPEGRTQAVQQVIQRMEQLQRYATDGHNHPHSTRYFRQLTEAVPGGFDGLMQKLRSNNPAEVTEALNLIRQHMPNGENEANQYRALRIVRNLGPESTAEELRRASERLELEINASRTEGGVNTHAVEWQQWARASEHVSALSQAARDNTPDAARAAVDALVTAARNGNRYARTELTAILVGNSDASQIGAWLTTNPELNGRPLYVPNFGGMNDALRAELLTRAADGLLASGQTPPLTQAEASGVAMALARADERNMSAELKEKLTTILQRALQGDGKEAALTGILEAARSGAPGSRALADLYLRNGGIDHAAFARHLPVIEQLAAAHDEFSLRILSAVAAGRADGNSAVNPRPESNHVSERARGILAEVGERPGMRDKVAEAILAINTMAGSDSAFRDRHGLMSTLGRVANGSTNEALRNQALDAIRTNFETAATDRNTDRFRSAFEGLSSMARHWRTSDAHTFISRLDANTVEHLRRNAEAIPEAVRTQIITELHRRVTANDTTAEDRLNAIRGMGAFARHLTTEQVRSLAGFGSDARYNTGGQTGDQRMAAMGITDANQRRQVRAEVAEVLMHVLSSAPNSRPGVVGPRETAYSAFRDLPWPIKNARGGLTEGRESDRLRTALVEYYQGRPFDISLASEINRVCDSAKLPRPAADIIRRLGIGDPNNMLDPERLRTADTIIRNYSSDGRSGEDVLRRVVSNIELVNSLPAGTRARLMGWTELTSEEKTALGWAEPNDAVKRELGWDRLSEEQRENIRWQGARVSAQQVLGQMFNNELQNAPLTSALLRDLSAEAATLRTQAASRVEQLTNELNTLNQQRRGSDGQGGVLGQLHDHTREGVSFGRRVVNIFNNAVDPAFERRQNELLAELQQLNGRIGDTQQRLGAADQHSHEVALAGQVGEYQRLLNSGDQVAADRLAIQMWRDHGPALAQLAPGVWRDLTVSTDNTLQGASMLRRLQTRGQAQWDIVPGYAAGTPGDPATSLPGLRQALGLENAANATERRGIAQLSPTDLMDTAALRSHMFGRIDQDPILRRVSNAARDLNGPLEELGRMFSAAQHGTIYENFINDAKDRAGTIRRAMNSVSEADLRAMEQRIELMVQARTALAAGPHNAQALRELDERIRTYKNMHNMLNRFDENPRYPDVITPDARGERANPNRQTRQMVDSILDNSLQPSTFTSWLRQNGPIIGATILAVAATVAACATFGVASPAAVGLWVAVAGLAAREVTNEVLYHVNNGGYTGFGQFGNRGSRVGHWGRTLDERTVWQNVAALGTDVVGPYAMEIARDWAAFVVTAGLSNYFFGGTATAREALTSVFRSPPPGLTQLAFQAERAALMSQGRGASASFMREFLQNFGRELAFNAGFTAVQSGAEAQVHEVIGPENVARMGEWGQFGLSFALSTGLAMGQGYRAHRRFLESANMTSGNHMEFRLASGVTEAQFAHHMRQQGFEVTQSRPGRWEVRPVNAPPGFRPIVMEDAAQRGQGRPQAEVTPTGETPTLRPAEARPENVEVNNQQTWRQTPEGQALLNEARAFSEHFLNQRYGQALDLARAESTLTAMPEGQTRTIRPYDVPFDLQAFTRASATERVNIMREFLQRMGDQAGVRQLPGGAGIEVTVPRPVIEGPNGMRINVATGEVTVPGQGPVRINVETGEVILAPGQARTATHTQVEAAFRPFREAVPLAQRQRIVAEQALIAMEERLHMQHAAMGERAFSPRYAEFVRDMRFDSPDHTESLGGRERSRASVEQEVLLALHDAGWPLSQLEHHFGAHHVEARRPVFEYLRAQEAIRRIGDADTRALVELAVQEATPSARRALLQNLPDIIQRYGNTPDLVTRIEQIRDASAMVVDGATSVQQLAEALNGVQRQFGDVARDPSLGHIIDQTVAATILRDGSFGRNIPAFIRDLHGAIGHFELPANSRTRAALEQRINNSLSTNRPRAELPIDGMAAIANRFGLGPEMVQRINGYDPAGRPPKTEILNRDIADAFVSQDPGRRSTSFDEFWRKMSGDEANGLSGNFRRSSDVTAHFGQGGRGRRGAELVRGSDNLFVIDVGGNNYRVLVKFDFTTGTASIRWAGTHAQYDGINPMRYN